MGVGRDTETGVTEKVVIKNGEENFCYINSSIVNKFL